MLIKDSFEERYINILTYLHGRESVYFINNPFHQDKFGYNYAEIGTVTQHLLSVGILSRRSKRTYIVDKKKLQKEVERLERIYGITKDDDSR